MDIAGFQAITGASEANARKFLGQANNNLELALSQYFEAGIEPETVPPPVTHDPVADGPSPAEAAKARVDAVLGADYLAALVTKDRTAVVPLLGVDARVTIHDLAAAVTLTHRFVNNGDAGVEATFMFRHDEAAVHSLVAEIGGKRVVGTIREKDAAFEEYSDAISARDTGILVEQGANEAALQLSIGNLPPGDEAVITLSFDVELALDGNSLKFVLPATAAETEPVAESTGDAAGIAGVTLTVNVATSFPLGELVCPSHEAAVTMGDDGHTGSLTIADGAAAGRSEFTLVITADDVRAPRVTVAPGVTEGEHALMVSFFPELEEGDEDEMTEMIFLVDRSGSMAGGRMRQARNALQLFLRSIPLGTRFNIVGFGSTYEKLFTASRPYNNKTLRAANAAVEAMDANLVGTNILPPLLDIFNSPTDDRFPRQIFVLTDGEVDNTAEVLDAVRDGAFGSRVFTFGIGGDASRALVRGMAVNGNGAAEFVRSGERLEPPVLRQVKRALQPALKSVSIAWGDAINTEALKQSPSVLPPVFDGDKFVLYGLTSDLDGGAAGSVTLSGELHGEGVSFQVPYDANAAVAAPSVARLAARSMIRELERLGRVAGGSDNAHKADIVDIALRYSLLSSYTSFVGVVEQEVATEGNMEVVTVDPVEAYRQGKGGAIGDGDYVNDVKLPANANDLLEGIAFGGAGMGGVRQQQQQRQRKLGKRLERRRGGGRANWGGPGAARAQASPAMAHHNAMFGGMGGGGGGGGGWGAPTAAAPAPRMALSRSSAVAAPADFNEYAQEGAMAYELYADDDENAREAVFDGFSFNDSPTMPTGVTLLADESSASRSDGDGDGDGDDYNEDADLRGSVDDGLVALGAAQRVLDPLVALQQAAGNWLLTGTLCALLETDGEAVEAGGVMPSNAVWATALAIAFIEGRLGEFRDEWEVLVGKGRKWLRRTFGGGDVDALLAAAGGKLGL